MSDTYGRVYAATMGALVAKGYMTSTATGIAHSAASAAVRGELEIKKELAAAEAKAKLQANVAAQEAIRPFLNSIPRPPTTPQA